MGTDCYLVARDAKRAFYFDRWYNLLNGSGVIQDWEICDPVRQRLLRFGDGTATSQEVITLANAVVESLQRGSPPGRATWPRDIARFAALFPGDTFCVRDSMDDWCSRHIVLAHPKVSARGAWAQGPRVRGRRDRDGRTRNSRTGVVAMSEPSLLDLHFVRCRLCLARMGDAGHDAAFIELIRRRAIDHHAASPLAAEILAEHARHSGLHASLKVRAFGLRMSEHAPEVRADVVERCARLYIERAKNAAAAIDADWETP